MACLIAPVAPEHIESFWKTCDAAFRESRMYAFTEAVPLPEFTRFVLAVIRNKDPQFVALDGRTVIGWCDVLAKPRPAMRHSGVLGIGVAAAYRRQGIGKALMETALAVAKNRGLTRVELFVRTDNRPAIRLYERFGFAIEGTLKRHMRIDGAYHDSYQMALLYD